MNYFEFEADIPIHISTSPIFAHKSDIYKRFVRFDVESKSIVDARNYSKFFIDSKGVKHIAQHDETWQSLECSFSDELIRSGKTWRIKTTDDELNEKQKTAHVTIKAKHAEALSIVTGNKSKEEVATFDRQVLAAYAHQDGNARPSQTKMLESLARGDGITVDQMATFIIAANDQTEENIGDLGEIKINASNRLKAGEDPDTVEAEARASFDAVVEKTIKLQQR